MEIKVRSLDKITSGETVVLDKGLVLSTEKIDHEKLVRCRSVGADSSLASSDPLLGFHILEVLPCGGS